MKAFILAAGFGKRMGELTRARPKPLLPLGGYPLLTFTLFQLKRWGVDAAVINLHYRGEMIAEFLKEFPYFPIHNSYEDEILGTAGGIRKGVAELKWDEPLIVINPDTIFFAAPEDSPHHYYDKIATGSCDSFLFLNRRPEDSTERGLSLLGNGTLSFAESEGAFFYNGYSLLHPRGLSELEVGRSGELRDFWIKQSAATRLEGREFLGSTYEVGLQESYVIHNNRFELPEELQVEWREFLDGWVGLK